MIKVAPSILSADFVNLERDIRSLPAAGADYVHVDVMDGMFVPNITIGIPVVAAISRIAPLPLDVHLMIERPIRYVDAFCKAGSSILTLHVEADTQENTLEALRRIRENGVRAAISVKPNTPAAEEADEIISFKPDPSTQWKARHRGDGEHQAVHQLRQWIDEQNPACELEVDGGVNVETAKICRDNGANVLVAGSAYFKAADPAAFVRAVKA